MLTLPPNVRALNIEMDADLYHRLKIRAAVEDRTLRSMVEEAVRRLLEEREAGKQA